MRPFPGENERREEVANNLRGFFNVAESLHNFWLNHPKVYWIEKSKLPPLITTVAVMLDIQASRLFRSAIEECKRCQGYSANIIARSLFETVLAMRFVLARKLLRLAVDRAKTTAGTPKVDSAGNSVFYCKRVTSSTPRALIRYLSQKKRASLFLASACFKDARSSQKLKAIPHMRRKVRKLAQMTNALISSYEKAIGAEWSSILRNSHSYSGLNVETLSKVMGKSFDRWYQLIYHFQSVNVHAGDPMRHLRRSDDEKLQVVYLSTDGEIRQALAPAITMFLIAIDTLQQSIGYGPDVDLAYASMKRRYKAQLGWATRP
jgi:hypothetical protein